MEERGDDKVKLKRKLEIGISIVSLGFLLVGFFYYLMMLFNHPHLSPSIRTVLICGIFLLLIFWTRADWNRKGCYLIIIFALMAMLLDFAGNDWSNLPLEWLFQQDHAQVQLIQTIAHSHSLENTLYQFVLVKSDGSILHTIHFSFILLLRFVEYLFITSFLLLVVTRFKQRLQLIKIQKRQAA
jgi:hypothetical protein